MNSLQIARCQRWIQTTFCVSLVASRLFEPVSATYVKGSALCLGGSSDPELISPFYLGEMRHDRCESRQGVPPVLRRCIPCSFHRTLLFLQPHIYHLRVSTLQAHPGESSSHSRPSTSMASSNSGDPSVPQRASLKPPKGSRLATIAGNSAREKNLLEKFLYRHPIPDMLDKNEHPRQAFLCSHRRHLDHTNDPTMLTKSLKRTDTQKGRWITSRERNGHLSGTQLYDAEEHVHNHGVTEEAYVVWRASPSRSH